MKDSVKLYGDKKKSLNKQKSDFLVLLKIILNFYLEFFGFFFIPAPRKAGRQRVEYLKRRSVEVFAFG